MLGLALSGRTGKALRHRLALPFVSQTQVRAVAWVIRPMTVTGGTSAATASAGDRTGAQIGELGNLLQQGHTLLFQGGNRIGHWSLLDRAYHIRSVIGPKKETNALATLMSHTQAGGVTGADMIASAILHVSPKDSNMTTNRRQYY